MDGVGISIIERPRPLPGHDTPNPTQHPYTLKCEEPDWTFGRDPKELEGIGHLSGDATGGDGYNSDPNAGTFANHSAYFYRAKEGQHNYSLEDIGKVIADTKER